MVRALFVLDFSHDMTKRQQRHGHELHVLYRERKADDRECKERRQQQMHDSELEPGQDYPDNVHDQRYGSARRFGFAYFATKWRDDTASKPEAHESERYADDREAQQDAAQNVADEDYESAEYEKNQITQSLPRVTIRGVIYALDLEGERL